MRKEVEHTGRFPWLLALSLCLIALCNPGANAYAAVGNAGASYPVILSSPADYQAGISPGSPPQLVWQDVIRHPGASYIAVHFRDFDLGPGDLVVIHDGKGGQRYELTGRGKMDAGTFWARHIKGERLAIELYTSGQAGGIGYQIDEYAAGYPAVATPGLQSVCGTDDKANAACYAASHTTEYARARAVARLLINGNNYCSGFLISSNNHFLTNQHCITNETDALNTDFEFMAEAPTCTNANSQGAFPGIPFSGSIAVRINANLDYALVRITNGNPAGTYGHLTLDDRAPVVGEPIYVPQHPDGRAKEIAIFSTHASDSGGVCRVQSIDYDSCAPNTSAEVGYFADTEPGSSGSPVLSSTSHVVIALHHCGGCQNSGMPAQLICEDTLPYLADLAVLPAGSVEANGLAGGPFSPACHTFTLSNNTAGGIGWIASTNVSWLEIHPSQGDLPAGAATTLLACVNAGAHSQGFGSHTGIVHILNTNINQSTERFVILNVGGEDAFTERFETDLDLDYVSAVFTPIDTSPYYTLCISHGVTGFYVNPAGHHFLALNDDDSTNMIFTGDFVFPFFGAPQTNAFVNSNGNISFDEEDSTFEWGLEEFFALPRIGLLCADLSPGAPDSITWTQQSDRIVVTFTNVPEWAIDNHNSMQAELFSNGCIRLTWQRIDAASGICGLSRGLGIPTQFVESDLSAYTSCDSMFTDLDGDGMDDDWEIRNGLIVGFNDAPDDDDADGHSNLDEYIADTMPTNNASYFFGITNLVHASPLDLNIHPTSTARIYKLEWSTNLGQGWNLLPTTRTGTGANLLFAVTNDQPALFLRTRVEVP